MQLMICLSGDTKQLTYLPEIAALGAGIELGGYGLEGIRSMEAWEQRLALHRALIERFDGPIAMHAPFIGIEYDHTDCLLREAIDQRLDLAFRTAVQLGAGHVIFHGGYRIAYDYFQLQENWLERAAGYWQRELPRWVAAGMHVVIENESDLIPDLLVRLADAVNHPAFGLCLDIGHQHLFSNVDAPEWVRRMGYRLHHLHLHDNDRSRDAHWPMGSGTIPFEPFFHAVEEYTTEVTCSLEVQAEMDEKMANLRRLAARFAGV